MARLTSELFVSALTRSAFNSGGFGAVLNKGAAEAGAIYIVWRSIENKLQLMGPAPQLSYEAAGERLFEVLLKDTTEMDISERLDREKRFDSDIWIIEVEMAEMPTQIELVDLSSDR